MRIHHLNCGTSCPRAAHALSPLKGLFTADHLICHCLLIEAPSGLVLVDTGLGMEAVRNPKRWLGTLWPLIAAPRLEAAETALRQIEALGFRAEDVRDIVVTHLDLDHAGGLADFPHAAVHVLAAELEAAQTDRRRYRSVQWAHRPRWVPHGPGGETWFGFEGVRLLDAAMPDILLIPMPGHSRGHAGVAVRTSEGWLVHAGDAYFHHAEVHGAVPSCPPGLAFMQGLVEVDRGGRQATRERLRELARQPGVRVFCAHDPAEGP